MKIIDLSLEIHENMTTYPDPKYPPPKLEFIITPDQDWMGRYSGAFWTFNHAGTHLDSPLHFNLCGGTKTIDKVPLEVLVGPAVIIGVPQVKTGPIDSNLLAANLPEGVTTKGKRLIVWTGYTDDRWGTAKYFEDAPYLTGDAAEWIVGQGFGLVALDCQTDKFLSKELPVHNTLLSHEVYILEYICNVKQLPPKETFLVVAPLRLKGMEASPARVFAIDGSCSPQ
jgi:kynurenine formamidase